jgi:Tfp pilus assembly protein PilN
MKSNYIIIAAALVLIAIFFGFAVVRDDQLTAERARNAELQKQIESLEQQVSALKDTDESYFQKGVDMQYAGNLQGAKEAFEALITKFPESNLAPKARERLIFVNNAIAEKEPHAGGAKGKTDKGTP